MQILNPKNFAPLKIDLYESTSGTTWYLYVNNRYKAHGYDMKKEKLVQKIVKIANKNLGELILNVQECPITYAQVLADHDGFVPVSSRKMKKYIEEKLLGENQEK
ncbi:hypothetical protein JXA27_06745 [Aerococcaceae bacterium zg-B36]|uniref:hypothetical protein n=1 Tax=Aerococcaceae bacterium zg-252 TaxID=2796928 RepID=UPI001BD8D632|nr:hypothetical protein [Aerococcaceae bacterium zg-B36]